MADDRFTTNIKTIWDLLYLVGHNHSNATVESCDPDKKMVRVQYSSIITTNLWFYFDDSGNLIDYKVGKKAEAKRTVYEKIAFIPNSRFGEGIQSLLDVDSLRSFHEENEVGLEELEELLKGVNNQPEEGDDD